VKEEHHSVVLRDGLHPAVAFLILSYVVGRKYPQVIGGYTVGDGWDKGKMDVGER
jgi:hypothetical protein